MSPLLKSYSLYLDYKSKQNKRSGFFDEQSGRAERQIHSDEGLLRPVGALVDSSPIFSQALQPELFISLRWSFGK